MRSTARLVLALVLLTCGCGTSRYRVLMSGLGSRTDGTVCRKFRLIPSVLNKDGSYSQSAEQECRIVARETAKYPDVFSDDGDVVRIRWLVVNNYSDGHGGYTSMKDNSFSGFVGCWNVLSALSLCTLPQFSEYEHAYRIALEFEPGPIADLGIRPRRYDFAGYRQTTVSLVPLLGLFFPYGTPDDTEFYSSAMTVVDEEDPRNHEVFWRAAVARAAVELRKVSGEIDFRRQEAERRKKRADNGESVRPEESRKPAETLQAPAPARPVDSGAPAISAEDIPM